MGSEQGGCVARGCQINVVTRGGNLSFECVSPLMSTLLFFQKTLITNSSCTRAIFP
ncbi:unnamed protein product [Haemonchus placei]|uniref:SUEL-type lectin domain-containing protein n=1 Tax=Haemonchus placei TaxID=6290 RepID=A0A0N4X9S3_HAEPC|nr:unnamed protein product [Haemonchus placei]